MWWESKGFINTALAGAFWARCREFMVLVKAPERIALELSSLVSPRETATAEACLMSREGWMCLMALAVERSPPEIVAACSLSVRVESITTPKYFIESPGLIVEPPKDK
jgi:hypothetical protein